jgi:hypothetical protein
VPQKNLIIYCDESTEKGKFYSHFYGGIMVPETHRRIIEDRLNAVKAAQGLGAELKWTKISEAWADRYIAFVDEVFDLMDEGVLRTRIMFTQNSNRPIGLSEYQLENQYFLLYYQLIKHAFGLAYSGQPGVSRRVSIFLDEMPRHADNVRQFKEYLASLSSFPNFRAAGVQIRTENITGVSSHHHVILQALDVIMGAMQFRLNDKHLDKPVGKFRRAKRTRAKERVYRHINARIQRLRKGFNIGVNTGIDGVIENRWHHPYRHWLFVPAESEPVRGAGKMRNR